MGMMLGVLFNWSEFTYCCNIDKNISISHSLSGARGHKVLAADHFFPQDVIIQVVYTGSDFVAPPHSTAGEARRLCSPSSSAERTLK